MSSQSQSLRSRFGRPGLALALAALCLISCQASCARNRVYESESSAIERIRQLQAQEARYRAIHGQYGDLAALGAASPVARELPAGTVAGYRLDIKASVSGYEIAANRAAAPGLPYRSFYADQTGVIRYSFAPNPATSASPRTDGRGDR